MKTVEYDRYGDIADLVLREVPMPRPAEDEVLVQILAAAVNPVDWKLLRGGFKILTGRHMPRRIGCDFAGRVVATGRAVTMYRPDEMVFGNINPLKGERGSMAEFLAVKPEELAPVPGVLSAVQAAALPGSGASALESLRMGRAEAGQHLLVLGASGGVGSYTVQIAKARGLHVTAVCSEKNAPVVRGLGADAVCPYDRQDPLTLPGRFSLIIDTVGKHLLGRCAHLLTARGHFVQVMPNARSFLDLWRTSLFGGRKAHALMLRLTPAHLRELAQLAADGRVRPLVGTTFPLERVRDAYALSADGHAVGKIVVRIGEA